MVYSYVMLRNLCVYSVHPECVFCWKSGYSASVQKLESIWFGGNSYTVKKKLVTSRLGTIFRVYFLSLGPKHTNSVTSGFPGDKHAIAIPSVLNKKHRKLWILVFWFGEAALPAWLCPGLCCVEAQGGVARLGTASYCHLRAHSASLKLKQGLWFMTLEQRKSFCRCLLLEKSSSLAGWGVANNNSFPLANWARNRVSKDDKK